MSSTRKSCLHISPRRAQILQLLGLVSAYELALDKEEEEGSQEGDRLEEDQDQQHTDDLINFMIQSGLIASDSLFQGSEFNFFFLAF